MANPELALGIVAGLIAGGVTYRRKKGPVKSLLAAVLVFFAFGTPLHFILIPAAAGYAANNLVYRYLNRNWTSFLLSILGLIPTFGLLQITGRLYITLEMPGPFGLGEAVGVAFGMGILYFILIIAGTISFTFVSLMVSFMRSRASRSQPSIEDSQDLQPIR